MLYSGSSEIMTHVTLEVLLLLVFRQAKATSNRNYKVAALVAFKMSFFLGGARMCFRSEWRKKSVHH